MKKFLLILCLVILQNSTVFASVEKHIDKQINYEMEYPIVYTKNQVAQDKINQDIYKYIATFRDNYNAGKFVKGTFSYEVKFENEKYVSLTIGKSTYTEGAGHDQFEMYGIVYDKITGKKLPLSNFLKITLEDFRFLSSSEHGIVFCSEGGGRFYKGTAIKKSYFYEFGGPKNITKDFYLLGNGGIALIYQPYTITSGAAGATSIRLSAEQVDYLNRKNKNL